MTHALALLALFQLAVPNNSTALISYPTLGYTLSGSHLIRLAGVPGARWASLEPGAAQYLNIQTAVATRAVIISIVVRLTVASLPYPCQRHLGVSCRGAHHGRAQSGWLVLRRVVLLSPVALPPFWCGAACHPGRSHAAYPRCADHRVSSRRLRRRRPQYDRAAFGTPHFLVRQAQSFRRSRFR